jgi:hypothetical protein
VLFVGRLDPCHVRQPGTVTHVCANCDGDHDARTRTSTGDCDGCTGASASADDGGGAVCGEWSASFRSPSGNINCSLSTPGGDIAARCEVVEHSWVAPPASPDCHLNWGDRFQLVQGGDAAFNCYGQEFPAVHETLAYGQARSFGSITCESASTAITCTDSSTGHYFRVSRDGYELG